MPRSDTMPEDYRKETSRMIETCEEAGMKMVCGDACGRNLNNPIHFHLYNFSVASNDACVPTPLSKPGL